LNRVALIPIRDFDGMTRLASALPPEKRSDLSRALADLALEAVDGTSMTPLVLTSDASVAAWAAAHRVRVAADSGGGLSASVTAAVAEHALPRWLVMHVDLPLVTSDALQNLASAADEYLHAIAPSVDGGTNVIAGSGAFRFAYGPASFHRHLSRVPEAAVVTDPALVIEIDTEMHLRSVRSRSLPPSLGL
jgi:2-phospho-L-lactate guanylyltransferase